MSVYRESIAADPALVERSRRLLEHFGWQGVAMVEYKVDERTGTPMLMEINGRFWGSLQLAVDAGVDFPRLLIECAEGTAPGGTAGIHRRHPAPLVVGRRRPAAAAPPPVQRAAWPASRGRRARLQSLAEFMNVLRAGDRNEILRFDDPVPFLHESLHWFLGR